MITSCPSCGGSITPEHSYRWDPIAQAEVCPSCGIKKEPSAPSTPVLRTEPSIAEKYLGDVLKILTRPTQFFRDLPFRQAAGNLYPPLVFALVTHWIAKALTFLRTLAFGGDFNSYFDSFIEQQVFSRLHELSDNGSSDWVGGKTSQILEWFSSLSSVILDPFVTLVTVLISSLLIYAGVYFLVPKRSLQNGYELNFESSLNLVCYGLTPVLLSPFPFLGGFIGKVYLFVVMVLGAKEIYRISTLRGILLVLFPKMLFLIIALFFGMLVLGMLSLFLVIPLTFIFSQ